VKSYLEKVKTELVTDPKLKQPITERTRQLRDTMQATIPKLCSERARLYTESWRETEGQPLIIRRAKTLDKILGEMSIFIRSDELIVGNQASGIRAAPVFPEFYMKFIRDELDGKPYRFEERPGDRFQVSEEDEKVLRELADWWEGKTMTDYKKSLYPEDVYKANYDIGAIEILIFGEGGGSGHFCEDIPKALKKGLYGIMEEAEEHLKSLKLWDPEDFEKKYFLEAVVITLKAAIKFAKRYAALAREMAEKETDPKRKTELKQIAEHCEWVPGNPPRTFWEALQLVWFLHLIIQIESNGASIAYGRFDQYMYPFYKKDIDEGKLTMEDVVELLECFFIKTTEINKVRSWDSTEVTRGYPMFQQLTIGGQTIDRESAVNDLSFLVLEAVENQKITQPSLSARYWSNVPEDFLMKCAEGINIHRGGMPQMHNDEAIIPLLLSEGQTLDDAYNWTIVGCEEPVVPGKSQVQGTSAAINLLKILEMTLYNGRDPRSGIQLLTNPGNKDLSTFESFDELKSALRRQIEYYNKLAVIGLLCTDKAYAEITPTPFASAFMDDCIKLGKDIEQGGVNYKPIILRGIGIANLGNGPAAIKKLMFEEKKLTGAQILHALETNFEDNTTTPTGEEIQQMLLLAPKFGNDDDYVDSLAREASDYLIRNAPNYRSLRGVRCSASMMSASQNVPIGQVCGATPDGRKAGMPSADGVSPTQGTDIKGATAAVKSPAKLNQVACGGGVQLNQKFNPILIQDISGLRKLAGVIRTYFEYKGQHIQFNVVSAETLKDAQKHPEKHPDLIVRVAGYSALFISLDPVMQNDIIARTEQTFS